MERVFYGGIEPELAVPGRPAALSDPANIDACAPRSPGAQIDLAPRRLGAGRARRLQPGRRAPVQPGHARRAGASTVRVQANNEDTDHRPGPADLRRGLPVRPADDRDARHGGMPLGQEGPPVQRHRRLEADGPARGPVPRATPEYPITLLQKHPDAILTATRETADTPSRSIRSGRCWIDSVGGKPS